MMPDFPIIKRGKKPGLKTIDSALDHFFSLMGGRAGAVENCTTFFSNPSPNKLNNHRRILKKIYQTLRLPPGMLKIQKKFGWCGGFCGYKIFIVQGCITPAKLRCVSYNMYFKIFNVFLNIFLDAIASQEIPYIQVTHSLTVMGLLLWERSRPGCTGF